MSERTRKWATRGARVLARGLWEHRWLWVLMLAALVVRLHWNLVVHPIEDYLYSDMRGYVRRSASLFEVWWEPREYDAFYPYGTHVLMYAIQAVFGDGPDDYRSLAVAFAIIGALLVGFGYALARRVTHHPALPPIVGLVLVAYYPLISLGGYALSEVPFSFCLVSSTFFLVRMAQDGRTRDAYAAGSLAALGAIIRPQLLASIGLLGVFWLVARKRLPRLRVALMLHALVPLLLVLGFSAWRFHYHTDRYGLISENGKFNQVFGRCHNNKIFALPDNPTRRRTSFGPPPLIQLAKREAKMPGVWPGIDPALKDERNGGLELEYRGYIGDSKILGDYIRRCIETTGWAKQLEYSLVNVLLLWRYNVMWPDSGKGEWREHARKWGVIHTNSFAVPALVVAFLVVLAHPFLWALWSFVLRPLSYVVVRVFVPRRTRRRAWDGLAAAAKQALAAIAAWQRNRASGLTIVALHLWAIVAIAALILGGVRFRSPYDPFIIILAVEAYGMAAWLTWQASQLVLRVLRRQDDRGIPAATHGESSAKQGE
ncbi:glycosyltransferase family 39 protein [Paraliomyxa miuraensis]|uniref:glycosyltransferase family 39 protein n=1 Tax=Paraliomyxa miuraensis TaxID=376150 RepID=UPI002250E440|nr:glycosyltransferase family 39 protein [Paraliomyxa miuraensis]MCX4245831.1 glycosyltransferase family 39 protein [Paraliomyxa miuraensis]